MAGIAPVVTVLVMVRAVLMVNLTVVHIEVHMVSASIAAGHAMVLQTDIMAQMKPIVVAVLQSAKIVNMIGHLMGPNAVIALGMRLV
jgi:hypothetical protein